MLGKTLGRFRIVAELGAGGMGEVYLAEDLDLKRKIALKILPPEVRTVPGRLERFRREAVALAALNHPGIVTVHSIEEVDGLSFLTMEWVDGRRVDEILPRNGLPLGRFFDLAVPLADALAVAHENGVTHRDLKPRNLMVTGEGQIKVLDFGLAKLRGRPDQPDEGGTALTTETLTRDGQVLGTVPYMSPEQIEGKELDHRTDIFSLGIVLYEMATGRRPFAGATAAGLISSILRDAPEPLESRRGDLPHHLDRILRLCLEKDRRRRFQSARDVRNELQSLREEIETSELERSAVPNRRQRWRKHRLRALAALALAAVLAGALLLGRGWPPKAGQTPPALAVLPFENFTGDPTQDYLSQGISAGLIGKLSGIHGLRLVGRSEVWSFLDRDLGPTELAHELGVGLIVDGHVQQVGPELQVTVSLYDTDRSDLVWSDVFTSDREQLLDLERDIVRRLTVALELPLSPGERRRMGRDPTSSYDAYDLYLKAQQHLESVDDPGSAEAAVELFRRAIQTDPEFALAHVGLSEALWKLHRSSTELVFLDEAEREAERALELDPELPEARVALARVYRSNGRYDSSIAAIEGVLAAHPRPDDAQRELAFSYEQIGDLEEAGRCYRAATALGAENWFNSNALGAFLVRSGQYPEADDAFDRAISLAPNGVLRPLQNLGGLRILQGDFEGALEAYERIPQPIRSANLAGNIGTAYYFSKRPDRMERAEEHYRQATRLDPDSPVIHGNLADLLIELGREEEALDHYRRAMRLVETDLEHRAVTSPGAFGSWRLLVVQRAYYAAKSRDCDKAIPLAYELREAIPESARDVHQLAHIFALCHEEQAALEAVRTAIGLGFSPELIAREDEFRELRDLPEFQALVGGPG